MTDSSALVVPDVLDADRLDRVVRALRPQLSWSRVRRLIAGGCVTVAGETITDAAAKVRAGTTLIIEREDEAPRGKRAAIELVVVYQDDAIVAVDKPVGLVSTPAGDKRAPNLLFMVRRKFGRTYLVHRLDRGTSGIIVFARTRRAHAGLLQLFRDGAVEKAYLAVVTVPPQPPEGTRESTLGRPDGGRRKSVAGGKRKAVTHYRTLGSTGRGTLIELTPTTGRTHQLRIHMSEMGCPIVGDHVYGEEKTPKGRLMLHAWKLGFEAPWSGEPIDLEVPPPRGFSPSRPRGASGPRRRERGRLGRPKEGRRSSHGE